MVNKVVYKCYPFRILLRTSIVSTATSAVSVTWSFLGFKFSVHGDTFNVYTKCEIDEAMQQSDQMLTNNGQKVLRGAISSFRPRRFNIAGATANVAPAVPTPIRSLLTTTGVAIQCVEEVFSAGKRQS